MIKTLQYNYWWCFIGLDSVVKCSCCCIYLRIMGLIQRAHIMDLLNASATLQPLCIMGVREKVDYCRSPKRHIIAVALCCRCFLHCRRGFVKTRSLSTHIQQLQSSVATGLLLQQPGHLFVSYWLRH